MRQEKRTKVRLEFIYDLEKRWDRQEKGTKVSLELIYDVEKGCQSQDKDMPGVGGGPCWVDKKGPNVTNHPLYSPDHFVCRVMFWSFPPISQIWKSAHHEDSNLI